ncbi:MFS general substrate transporter [Xylariomycetidae sp. FL0641]|nr:MFS general substrate transporter [Xylariomycetidae sp. FL0641]
MSKSEGEEQSEARVETGIQDGDGASTQAEDASEYPTGFRFTGIIVATTLAVLCVGLDRTIIGTAVPQITQDFQSLNDVAWYGSAYSLTSCAFQPLWGKVYTRLPAKWDFVISLFIFEIGSAISGAAPNSTALIIGRAIAGVGGAGVFSGALVITALILPLKDRPKVLGAVTAFTGAAQAVAPSIGGAFTQHVTWRWCFYINLPLGAVSIAGAIWLLQLSASGSKSSTWMEHIKHLDLQGTLLLFVPSMTTLTLALQWGGIQYAWSNWRVILLLIVFGVTLLAWGAWQVYRRELATVPPRIIQQRSIYVGLFHITVIGAINFTAAYYIPIWFQAVHDYTAQVSGVNYIALSLSTSVCSLLCGVVTSKIGYYVPVMYVGGVSASIGTGLLFLFNSTTSTAYWAASLVCIGIGVGLSWSIGVLAAQTVLGKADLPIGTSLMMFGQTLGGTLALPIAQNIFQNELEDQLAAQVPDLNPNLVISAGAANLRGQMMTLLGGDTQAVNAVIESYSDGLHQVWIMMLVLGLLTLLGAAGMEWRNLKKAHDPETSTSSEREATDSVAGKT